MRAEDTDLDRAIDIVADDMTKADVSAGFRVRVIAKIDEGPRRGVVAVPRWAWAAAATVVLTAAIGTWFLIPGVQPQPQGSFAAATAPPTVVELGSAPIVAEPSASTTSASKPGTARPRQAARVEPRRHGLAWEAGPEPLAEPEPIAIDALSEAAMEVPRITVAPMDEIPPITIPPAGPGLPDRQRRN